MQRNILLCSQHGFHEKLSSVTQLISSFHDLARATQSRDPVDVVFLDISMAFDEVPYRRLSVKLSYNDMNGLNFT